MTLNMRDVLVRKMQNADLPRILQLLADDELGQLRETLQGLRMMIIGAPLPPLMLILINIWRCLKRTTTSLAVCKFRSFRGCRAVVPCVARSNRCGLLQMFVATAMERL